MCGKANETVNHILGECNMLAQRECKRRHDCVGRKIHWELCRKYGLAAAERWYEPMAEIQVFEWGGGGLCTIFFRQHEDCTYNMMNSKSSQILKRSYLPLPFKRSTYGSQLKSFMHIIHIMPIAQCQN